MIHRRNGDPSKSRCIMGTIMVKKVQLRPPMMAEAKPISSGPKSRTAFSTRIVHAIKKASRAFSAVMVKRRPQQM